MTIKEFVVANSTLCNITNPCPLCPVRPYLLEGGYEQCNDFRRSEPEKYISIVEKWWNENKPVTNAEWYAEELMKLGFKVDIYAMKKYCCPVPNFNHFTTNKTPIDCNGTKSCIACREWWDKEHEEVK